jgi:hypothetical protein
MAEIKMETPHYDGKNISVSRNSAASEFRTRISFVRKPLSFLMSSKNAPDEIFCPVNALETTAIDFLTNWYASEAMPQLESSLSPSWTRVGLGCAERRRSMFYDAGILFLNEEAPI